jgi:hypothetical protein
VRVRRRARAVGVGADPDDVAAAHDRGHRKRIVR